MLVPVGMLDEAGESALPFRAPAARLGCGVASIYWYERNVASIYWYVQNKDELLDRGCRPGVVVGGVVVDDLRLFMRLRKVVTQRLQLPKCRFAHQLPDNLSRKAFHAR